jgi:hypothetical protein
MFRMSYVALAVSLPLLACCGKSSPQDSLKATFPIPIADVPIPSNPRVPEARANAVPMDGIRVAIVALLVPLLESEQFRVREDASKALSQIGAVTDLRQQLQLAQVGRSSEAKRRLEVVASKYELYPSDHPHMTFFPENHPGWRELKETKGPDGDFEMRYMQAMYKCGYTREMLKKVVHEAWEIYDKFTADELRKQQQSLYGKVDEERIKSAILFRKELRESNELKANNK